MMERGFNDIDVLHIVTHVLHLHCPALGRAGIPLKGLGATERGFMGRKTTRMLVIVRLYSIHLTRSSSMLNIIINQSCTYRYSVDLKVT